MKRALIISAGIVGGLLALVLIAVAVLLLVVDPNDYKSDLTDLVKQKTGLELAINDRMGWSLWPGIGVRLGKVTLTDPVAKETLLAVDKAAVSVQLLPLLSKHIAVNAVLLDGARVRFIQHADGSTSWDSLLSKQKGSTPPEPQTASAQPGNVAFNIRKLDVQNTSLLLKDENTGVERTVDSITVMASDIGDGTDFPLHLGFVFRQQQADGKSLVATTTLDARVRLNQEKQLYDINGLALKTALAGTLLPAAPDITLNADIHADVAAKQAKISKLHINVNYPQAGKPAPMTLGLASDALTLAWGEGGVDVPRMTLTAGLPGSGGAKPLTVNFSSPFMGNWKRGDFSLPAFVLDAAGVHTQGSVDARLPAMAATDPATPMTKGMSINGNIATAAFNPRAALAAAGITTPKTADANVLRNASFSADIRGDEKQVLLQNIRLRLDDSTLTGEAGINDLATMRQYARLVLDRMNADRYLPPPATTPAAAAGAAPAAGGGGVLPVDLLKKQNLDAAFSAGNLTLMGYQVTGFRVAATAGNGVLNVSTLKGSIYSGGFSAPLSVNVQGAQPVLRLQPRLEHMEIGPLARRLLKKDLVEGKASYDGDLTLRGNTVAAWMKSVSGSSNLKLDNGVLHGVNAMKELTGALGKYQGLLALTGKDADTLAGSQSDTEIANLAANNTLDNGVLNTTSLTADLRKAKVAGSGSFNLVSQDLDYRFTLNLDKSVAGERNAGYPLPVRCKGNLGGKLASLCSLDSSAVRDMMLKAAASKGLEKLGIKSTGQGTSADLKQKAEDEKQKAKEKLNEKLNEGLNRLFKR